MNCFQKCLGKEKKFTEIKDKLPKRKLGGKSLVNFQKEKSQGSIFRKKKRVSTEIQLSEG